MDRQTLQLTINGHVARITLHRPEVRNAFNDTMIAELASAVQELAANDAVRVVILAASGAAFCAGADLNWMARMAQYSDHENRTDAMRLAQTLRIIHECPKPVVACVQGDCFAGGVGLVAACDIALGAESAHFCLSEVKLGLIPATISPYVLRAIGERAANRYMLTAERFSAREAQRIGLLHEVVADDKLPQAVEALAATLAANSPQAVAQAKRLVREVAGQPIDDALLADTAARIAGSRASEDGREGIAAFLEKRKPRWQE